MCLKQLAPGVVPNTQYILSKYWADGEWEAMCPAGQIDGHTSACGTGGWLIWAYTGVYLKYCFSSP